MIDPSSSSLDVNRRDLLKLGGLAAGVISGARVLHPSPALAQTPKRGGTLRLSSRATPSRGSIRTRRSRS